MKGYRITQQGKLCHCLQTPSVMLLQEAAVRMGVSGLISGGRGLHLPSAQKTFTFIEHWCKWAKLRLLLPVNLVYEHKE